MPKDINLTIECQEHDDGSYLAQAYEDSTPIGEFFVSRGDCDDIRALKKKALKKKALKKKLDDAYPGVPVKVNGPCAICIDE